MLDCVAILAYLSLETTEMPLLLNYTHHVWVVGYLVIVVVGWVGYVTVKLFCFVPRQYCV